jgi:hypothetical protein
MACTGFEFIKEKAKLIVPGPRSYLSICSKPGVKWVSKKTGSKRFDESAGKFAAYITHRLKIEKSLPTTRRPDPDIATAWRYTNGNSPLKKEKRLTLN